MKRRSAEEEDDCACDWIEVDQEIPISVRNNSLELNDNNEDGNGHWSLVSPQKRNQYQNDCFHCMPLVACSSLP